MVISVGPPSISVSSEKEYQDAINGLTNPTFNEVRKLATRFYNSFPSDEIKTYPGILNRGTAIVQSLQHCAGYLQWHGGTHQRNLTRLYGQRPENLFEKGTDLVDWGCGQGLATMVLCDVIKEKRAAIKTVTLIDPSDIALQQAQIYVAKFLPETEIKVINSGFDTITPEQFIHCAETTRVHLFANIIDVETVDLDSLGKLLGATRAQNDYYFCLNPAYQGDWRCNEKDNVGCPHICRFDQFINGLDGRSLGRFCQYTTKGGIQSEIIHRTDG